MLDTFLSFVPLAFTFVVLCLILDSIGIRNIKEEYVLSPDIGKRTLRVIAITIGICAVAGVLVDVSSGLVALPFLFGSLALYGIAALRYADTISRWFGSRRQ